MSENNPTNGRLDSWKEIAAYLNKDVRTAIRYEKERGLPVHHVPGQGRRTIFAFRYEIDAWLHQIQDEESQISLEKPITITTVPEAVPAILSVKESQLRSEPTAKGSNIRRRWITATALVTILGAVIGYFAFGPKVKTDARTVVSIDFASDSIKALDGDGNLLWSHKYDHPLLPETIVYKQRLLDLVHIVDLKNNGEREILVAVALVNSNDSTEPATMELDCFSDKGKLLWSYIPRESFQFGNHDINAPWYLEDVYVSEGPNPTIWVAVAHWRWGNSFVANLDPVTGKDTVRFVNTGALYRLRETEVGGRHHLLVAGFNNEYASGILAVIDEARPYSVSPQTSGTRHKCMSCGEGMPDYYFVFPRSEVNRLLNQWEDSVRYVHVNGSTFEIEKAEFQERGNPDMSQVHVIYGFSTKKDIRPISFRFDSWYDLKHQEMEKGHKLDHSIDKCPERLHPLPVRLWTLASGWTEIKLQPIRAVD